MSGAEPFALALDLGGTKIEAGLVTAEGRILDGSRVRRPTGREVTPWQLRTAIAEVTAESLGQLPEGAELLGAGIGSAGPVDLSAGTIIPVNMPGVHGFPLAAAVADALAAQGYDALVRQGHDGGCLALAESWIGAAAGAAGSLSIVVSTGIGGGIVLAGRLVTGASGNAGHLGQTRAGDGDATAEVRTLEEVASGPASAAWARAQGWEGATGEDLARSAAAGDRIARAAIERSARAVGGGLADASTLLDLEVIAIGGGFSRVSEDYIELVQDALHRAVVLDYARQARVVRSSLGDTGPLVGAAALVLRAAD